MRIKTFQEHDCTAEPFHGVYGFDTSSTLSSGEVLISFTVDSCSINAAHVYMSAAEARTMAKLLLIDADRLEGKT